MEKGWKHKKTESGNVILKDKQEDLKKSLQKSGLNIDFGGYEEFDGENVIYVHYPKKDEDKVANFLNNWLSKHSWKNATTAYESVDDFSGKKGYWTYVIEEANHSMAKGGGVKNSTFKVGDVVSYSDGFQNFEGKIIADFTDKKFYVGDKYGYQVSGFGDRLKPEQLTLVTKKMSKGGGVGKKALYQSDKNKVLTDKIIDTTHSFFESNGVKYGQVSDLGTEIVIEPSTVIPANSNLKKGSLDGMQIIYDIKSNVYEVSEYMAGPNENEMFIFGEYKSLIPALKSLIKGNSSTGRKPIKKYAKGGGVKSSNNVYKLRAEGLNDFLAFLQQGMYFRVKSFTVETTSGPDVVVSFTTDASLSEIKSKLDEVPDSHVMIETVKPINEYTGERNEEYANGGGVSEKITKARLKAKLYQPSGDFFIEDKGDKWFLHFTPSDASRNAQNLSDLKAESVGKGFHGSAYSVSKVLTHKYAKGGGVREGYNYLMKNVNFTVVSNVIERRYIHKGQSYKVIAVILSHGRKYGNEKQFTIIDETGTQRNYAANKFVNGIDIFDKAWGESIQKPFTHSSASGANSSSKLKYSLFLDRTIGDNVTTYHIADFAAKGDLSIALESLKEAAPKNYMYYTK